MISGIHLAPVGKRDGQADGDADNVERNRHANHCWTCSNEEGGGMPSTAGRRRRGSAAGPPTAASKKPITRAKSKSDTAKSAILSTRSLAAQSMNLRG